MGEALGQILAPAVVVAFSPISLAAAILVLFGPRPRATGPAFAAGFGVGILALGAVLLGLAALAGVDEGGDPSTAADALKVALGLALVVLAVRKLRGGGGGEGDEDEVPRWMRRMDRLDPRRATTVGLALGAANPKNVVLTAAAAATIAQAGLPGGESALLVAVFALIGSAGVTGVVAYALIAGERAAARLDRWKDWLVANDRTVVGAVLVVIGAVLVGQGISGLA